MRDSQTIQNDTVLIKNLGGPVKVAKRLSVATGHKITHNRVNNWKTIGIPSNWRPMMAQIAMIEGLTLQSNFLAPFSRSAAPDDDKEADAA